MSSIESINSRTSIGQKIARSIIHIGPRPDQVIPAYYPSLLKPVHTVAYGPQGSKWANGSDSARSSNNSLVPHSPTSSHDGRYNASSGEHPVSSGNNTGFHNNFGRVRAAAELHVSASENRNVIKWDGKKTWARGSQIGWCGKDDTDSDFVKNFYKDDGLSGGGYVGGATDKEGSGNGALAVKDIIRELGAAQNNDGIF
jgi:hypothetical protein